METKPPTRHSTARRWPVLPILLGLDAFALGTLVALLTVNRLLWRTAHAYAPYDTNAASTVLDLIDDLLAYLYGCAVLLLFLALITIAASAWLKARSPIARYGVTALLLVLLLLSTTAIGVWTLRVAEAPAVLPMTPTPTPAQGVSWTSQAPAYRATHGRLAT